MKNYIDLIDSKEASAAKTYKKGELIQQPYDSNTNAIYVRKGLLRSYIIDSKGKEHIYTFAAEGWIIGDIEAMEYQFPTELYIDCLEDSEVIRFDKSVLLNTTISKEQLVENTQLLSRRIGRLQRRVLLLMGAPAADRYEYFLKTYPELANRVPQKMIASYLGIAPQTLSSIRAKNVRTH